MMYEEKTVNRGRRPKKLDRIILTVRRAAIGWKRADETGFDFFELPNEAGEMGGDRNLGLGERQSADYDDVRKVGIDESVNAC
jgi:hypothetical protein